jgi:hypothetical protein
LARHEGELRAEGQSALSLRELLDLLGAQPDCDERSREHAIACYLSGGDGWREAVKILGGTFAGEEAGLRERKAD